MARAAIGALRARLDIERPVDTPDGAGGAARSWVVAASVFAEIRPVSGDERLMADRMEQAVTHRITLRPPATLTSAMRFRLGSRVFVIRSVVDADERGARLTCLCEETRP